MAETAITPQNIDVTGTAITFEAANAAGNKIDMTTGPKSPGAPQASRRHHATWTRSPSPVGRSRATGPPVRRLYSV